MRHWVIVCLLFLGIVLPLVSRADECGQAKEYYQKAKASTNEAEQIELLQRSVALCPTFSGYKALASIYQRQGAYDQARNNFDQASLISANDTAKGEVLGRSAECLAALGDNMAAASRYREALKLLPKDQAPERMRTALRELDMKQSTTVVPARSIVEGLSRGVGVVGDEGGAKVPLAINFAFNSDRVEGDGFNQLDELGRALTDATLAGKRFLLVGHTDKNGTAEYNQNLSERRSAAVATELAGRYPALTGHLRTEGKGMSELRYPGNQEDDHRLNRRVEVTIVP